MKKSNGRRVRGLHPAATPSASASARQQRSSGSCKRLSATRFRCEIAWRHRTRTIYAGDVTFFYSAPAGQPSAWDSHYPDPAGRDAHAASAQQAAAAAPIRQPQARVRRAAVSGSLARVTRASKSWPASTGRSTPTAEATVGLEGRRPLPRRRRLRGDPPLRGQALRAGRPPRPARPLGRRDRARVRPRARWRARSPPCSAQAGPVDGQLRLIVTRGGRRIAATEPIPTHAETLGLATVTYSPTVILNGVKSLSYAANMQASRIAKGQRRRRGGAGPPRRHRAGAADLGDLLGLGRRRAADAGARRRRAGVDHPRPPDQGAATSRRAAGRSRTCAAPARPSSPRPRARSRPSPRSTAPSLRRRPGPAHAGGPAAFAETLGRELRELR